MARIDYLSFSSTVWLSENPILQDGVIGKESDTGKSKLGNGISNWNDLPYFTGKQIPKVLDFSTTPVHDYTEGSDRVITLTNDITVYTLKNVPDGEYGDIALIQDGVGGYGIASIVQNGLTTHYISNNAPTAANINSDPNRHTVVSYKRMGLILYVSYGGF